MGKEDLNLFSSERRDGLTAGIIPQRHAKPSSVPVPWAAPGGPTALTALEELVHTGRDAFTGSRVALLYRHRQAAHTPRNAAAALSDGPSGRARFSHPPEIELKRTLVPR